MKPHDLQHLIDLYNSGLTLRQIAPLINRSHVAVYFRLRNVIKLRPRFNTRAGNEWLERGRKTARNSPNLPAAVPFGSLYKADCPKCMISKKVYAKRSGDAWAWRCSSCEAEGVAPMVQTPVKRS